MYRELSTILNWPEAPHFPTTGKFILVRDSLEADGAVLLPHFLFGYLKADKRALLVGLEQSFFHYSGVGRKLVRHPPPPLIRYKIASSTAHHDLRGCAGVQPEGGTDQAAVHVHQRPLYSV
jgi:hypothetical protein